MERTATSLGDVHVGLTEQVHDIRSASMRTCTTLVTVKYCIDENQKVSMFDVEIEVLSIVFN